LKGGFEIFNKGFLLIYKGIKKTSKAKVIAANAQGQAHLQFAQNPPSNQKLQKSLPFSRRSWQVYRIFKVLKN